MRKKDVKPLKKFPILTRLNNNLFSRRVWDLLVSGRRDPLLLSDLTDKVYKGIHTLPPLDLKLWLFKRKHMFLTIEMILSYYFFVPANCQWPSPSTVYIFHVLIFFMIHCNMYTRKKNIKLIWLFLLF
jgi:hypothetical protein